MTPAHELLIFEPNKNGKWPLVKVKQWWTTTSESTVLNIPGWSGKDAKNLEYLSTDLQVTPDGRYAIVFAQAEWQKSADGTVRKPDAIVTVIDLSRWQIVNCLHTVALGLGTLGGQRILSSNLLALKGYESETSRTLEHYRVISLPGLELYSGCETETPHLNPEDFKNREQTLRERNNAACSEVLTTSKHGLIEDLDVLIRTGQKPEPKPVAQMLLGAGRNIVQSVSGNWYGLDSMHSEITRWSPAGEERRKRSSPNLLCEKQPVVGPAWDCSCNIPAVSEDQNVLLAHCLTQHDNFFGSQVWLKQWLAIFNSDDLAEIGFVRLSKKNEETKETISAVNGHTYLLAVSVGDTLRVYQIPSH